jgi:hypothetical protein
MVGVTEAGALLVPCAAAEPFPKINPPPKIASASASTVKRVLPCPGMSTSPCCKQPESGGFVVRLRHISPTPRDLIFINQCDFTLAGFFPEVAQDYGGPPRRSAEIETAASTITRN